MKKNKKPKTAKTLNDDAIKDLIIREFLKVLNSLEKKGIEKDYTAYLISGITNDILRSQGLRTTDHLLGDLEDLIEQERVVVWDYIGREEHNVVNVFMNGPFVQFVIKPYKKKNGGSESSGSSG